MSRPRRRVGERSVPTPAHARRAPRPLAQPERASRRELWLLGAFFFSVVALADIFNVRLGVELLTVSVLIAAFVISRRGLRFLRDWWFYLIGLVMWNLSGPIAAQSPFRTHAHLDLMYNIDHTLFLGHDPVSLVQKAFIHPGHVGPIDIVTAAIYNMHLPEPFIAGYFLWRLSRSVYLQFAVSALILLIVGYVTFIVFPAVPPWLASEAYGKIPGVINNFGPVLRWHPMPFHGTPIFYVFKLAGDPIAAFPSEHAAIPMLELLAFSRVAGKTVVTLFVLWVLAVLFSIVYLGEHWVTDALAGYVYAIVIFAGVVAVTESRRLRARHAL